MNDRARSMQDSEIYGREPTFMGVPYTRDLKDAKAAILGIPFDVGVHPTRVGARLGPRAIRESSVLVRPYWPPHRTINPVEILGVVDCGDAKVTPGDAEGSFDAIEGAVARIVDAGAIPITMGGDGIITLPQLRAVHRKYPGLAVLHVDAHTDAYPDVPNDPYNTGSTFTHAAREGLIDVGRSIHVGARGTTYEPRAHSHAKELGYEMIDAPALFARGLEQTAAYIHERMKGRPVFLCWDMDFFDPSCAPGVCIPTWGGANAREAFALLEALDGLDFVAFDINNVSPPHDVGGMTSHLAGMVMVTWLHLAVTALKKRGVVKA